ncbi:MAG: SRPBCC domain-containing protein, partial [Acidimicrobiia bacterium]
MWCQGRRDERPVDSRWGPPGWPATFTRHDMAAGGRSEYHMTGPDGERSGGYWVVEAIDPGTRIDILDGFTHDDGSVNDEMPTMRMRMTFEATPNGSRLVSVTTFPDLA